MYVGDESVTGCKNGKLNEQKTAKNKTRVRSPYLQSTSQRIGSVVNHLTPVSALSSQDRFKRERHRRMGHSHVVHNREKEMIQQKDEQQGGAPKT